MNEPPTLPAPHVCEQARLSRDARFDGLFFTAVSSTGIYCRPVCPAPAPKRENVHYYPNAAAAEAAGFRPCLRCRPELAPGNEQWQHGDHVVARALKLIEAGTLAEQSLDTLAARVGIGARQLRRLFVERLGATPVSVHTTRRLLFAKQLLTETALPVTEVALASGFRSLRRFNAAFAQANRIAPRELRRHPRTAAGAALVLRLGYRPPYDFPGLLAFLRTRALPGVELVDARSYARVFGPADAPGWLWLSAWPGGEHALQLQLHCPQPTRLLGVVTTLRRMFDLDANPQAIADTFRHDAVLGPLVARHPGLRLPGGWDGFEIAVRAILGQQISVAAARTLATRIVQRWGEPLTAGPLPGLERLFPTPAALAQADLREIGLTTARATTINTMAQALLDGRVDFRAEQSLDEFAARWVALPGIGAWTAHYIAMRALSAPDAFPAADLILRREAATDAAPLSTKALTERANAWRPWRAYAVIHLWRGASETLSPARRKKTEAMA
ncbi:DNA methylase [Rhodanobacter thiooxydans]|uniref:DNA-3-methyladenine glycosylase II n=1 Tax=Rhodanobacter thiooxydans TaxID=416169 RepID=A0A154QDD3_9GAMM|nr:DNA-3-methyladenine glycosylase 2 [Rhodanobacter thiooxydans]EIM01320.1 AraC family transcriptional regulator [Rhodanobacter thiooxydans LCS2]KZC22202.1 DNA methylase [Rhodanobacter thiooxydans]